MKQTLSRVPHDAPLISSAEIDTRVAAMALEISSDYRGRQLMGAVVLKGGFIFASDLVRHMDSDLRLEIDFVRASSYGNDVVSSGSVQLEGPDPALVAGRHVLVIEDLLDTGNTLAALLEHLWSMTPASVEIATLLSKDREHHLPTPVRYVGFHIPNEFVVGYGLDYGQAYRHLPDIRVLTAQ